MISFSSVLLLLDVEKGPKSQDISMWQVLSADREKADIAKAGEGCCGRQISSISPDKAFATPVKGCGLLSVGEELRIGSGLWCVVMGEECFLLKKLKKELSLVQNVWELGLYTLCLSFPGVQPEVRHL